MLFYQTLYYKHELLGNFSAPKLEPSDNILPEGHISHKELLFYL